MKHALKLCAFKATVIKTLYRKSNCCCASNEFGDQKSSAGFAKTPHPPYYAVIFTSRRTGEDKGYSEMADRIMALATQSPGFLGVESVRGADGLGITVSYWTSEEAILHWRQNSEHQIAQRLGKQTWYQDYMLRVAKVERAYGK